MRARRLFFRALLASIAISAVMGIWAILGGDFDDLQLKVLATSMSISAASVLGIAALSGWHLSGARALSRAGVGASLAALLMTVPAIWLEIDADAWWQLTLSFVLVAVGAAHGTLLAHTRLAPRFAWARPAATALAGLLGCLLLALLWEVADDDDALTQQSIAVVSILLAAATLAVVVFHFMSRVDAVERGGADICFCPRCGKRMWQPAGEVRCSHCDARFRIDVLPTGDVPTAIARG
ncbi:MAG TPA: hypothetical protein VMZ28_09830 [Kofleriaceae bacterium]|nr:hypothetical protein [Kofleriaceae bacterium]